MWHIHLANMTRCLFTLIKNYVTELIQYQWFEKGDQTNVHMESQNGDLATYLSTFKSWSPMPVDSKLEPLYPPFLSRKHYNNTNTWVRRESTYHSQIPNSKKKPTHATLPHAPTIVRSLAIHAPSFLSSAQPA